MRSSSGASLRISSIENFRGVFTSPSTETVQGEVFGSDFFADGVIAFYGSEFAVRLNGAGVREDRGEAFADEGSGSGDTQTAQKIPSVEIEIFRSNVGVGEFRLVLDEHVSCLEVLAADAGCPSLIEYARLGA
jgi:hypothetical protein